MDTAPHVEVRVAHRYGASPERVFDAWIDPETAGLWLFATASRPMARVNIDARVGGSFCFVERRNGDMIEHTGEYIEIARPRRLVFTLSAESGPLDITRVITEIVPLGRGCKLTLTHENMLAHHASSMKARWTGILYGLSVTLARRVGRRKDSTTRNPHAARPPRATTPPAKQI